MGSYGTFPQHRFPQPFIRIFHSKLLRNQEGNGSNHDLDLPTLEKPSAESAPAIHQEDEPADAGKLVRFVTPESQKSMGKTYDHRQKDAEFGQIRMERW